MATARFLTLHCLPAVMLGIMLFTASATPVFADVSLSSLVASTFVGGSASDVGFEIKLDGEGNVFVTGLTSSSAYPTTAGAFDTTYNGGVNDGFVTKLSSDLTTILASTLIGGSAFDRVAALAFDEDGDVFITGTTFSSNFPTSSGALDTTFNGVRDAFVAKLDSDLTTLLASTFIGGSNREEAIDIALDEDGDVFIVGTTRSSNYPTTVGAFDTTRNGVFDAFVTKLDNDLTTMLASTLVGGSDLALGFVIPELAFALAVDESDNVFVTGATQASDYPTTAGAFDPSHNGGTSDAFAGAAGVDLFVSKLDGDLTTLLASTFIGGSGNDGGGRFGKIALDEEGNVFVSSLSASADYPTAAGAFDTTYNGFYDGVLSKLDGDLTTLLASTFIGGTDVEDATAMALDEEGNVFVAGVTGSSDYPTTAGAFDTTYNGGEDAFAAQLDGDLTTLLASTFIGGSDPEDVLNAALNQDGNLLVTGVTGSSDYPTTAGAFDITFNGAADVFVFKLAGEDDVDDDEDG